MRQLLMWPQDMLHAVPLTPTLSPGRGSIVHRLSVTPAREFARQPSAKQQSIACCSLSPRERVRVRGKHPVENAKGRISPKNSSVSGPPSEESLRGSKLPASAYSRSIRQQVRAASNATAKQTRWASAL